MTTQPAKTRIPRDTLSALSPDRIAPPTEIAVDPDVWRGARLWHTISRRDTTTSLQGKVTRRLCGLCGQSLNLVSVLDDDGVEHPYMYGENELTGLTLAHLIQRHGWTRESIPIDQITYIPMWRDDECR